MGVGMNNEKFCCEEMRKNWIYVCSVSEREKGVGIIQESYHVAGYTDKVFTRIHFCPWCAANINTGSVNKEFLLIEKANTIECFNCNQMIFAKEYQEELGPNAGLCFDCQEKIAQKLKLKEAHNVIQQKIIGAVRASGSKKAIVVYKAYSEDSEKVPIDNLHEVAVKGKCRFANSRSVYLGKTTEQNYLSKVVIDPTWLQVAIMANEMLEKTKQTNRVCLEGIILVVKKYGINRLVFSMSSYLSG